MYLRWEFFIKNIHLIPIFDFFKAFLFIIHLLLSLFFFIFISIFIFSFFNSLNLIKYFGSINLFFIFKHINRLRPQFQRNLHLRWRIWGLWATKVTWSHSWRRRWRWCCNLGSYKCLTCTEMWLFLLFISLGYFRGHSFAESSF